MNRPPPPTREAIEAAEANPAPPTDSDDSAPPAPPAAPAQPAAASEAPPKKIRATPASVGIMAVVAAVGIGLIMWAWHLGPFDSTRVSTDNAYVRGAITVLAPQVNGFVADVLVKDYQYVKAGQELLRIDDRIYRERVRAAEGQVANATAQLNNAEQTQARNTATVGSARQSRRRASRAGARQG